MVDLNNLVGNINIAAGMIVVALLIFLNFFAKFPSRKSLKK